MLLEIVVLTEVLLAILWEFGADNPDEFWSSKLADPCLAYKLLALLTGSCWDDEERLLGLGIGTLWGLGTTVLIVVVDALKKKKNIF